MFTIRKNDLLIQWLAWIDSYGNGRYHYEEIATSYEM
jgi:hypothetical protein